MFKAKILENGDISFHGRLDASQVDKANAALGQVDKSCTINFHDLEYISSAGLGVLISNEKRLKENGHTFRLIGLNKHIRDVFRYTGFDHIFEIE